MEKPKACPWCGGDDCRVISVESIGQKYSVWCSNCGAGGPRYENALFPVAIWNKGPLK